MFFVSKQNVLKKPPHHFFYHAKKRWTRSTPPADIRRGSLGISTSNKELFRKLRSTNQRGELGMKVIPTWLRDYTPEV